MTEKTHNTKKFNVDHSTYGGKLSLFDFEGHYTLAGMAAKIESDLRFDRMCKANAKMRANKK